MVISHIRSISAKEDEKIMVEQSLTKKSYILVDYENVQPVLSQHIESDKTHFIIFVGSHQSRISYELAASLQPLGKKVQYIKMNQGGRNSLDFHIAYFIGKLSTEDKQANFVIISNDKGFDPLVEYLNRQDVMIQRLPSESTASTSTSNELT